MFLGLRLHAAHAPALANVRTRRPCTAAKGGIDKKLFTLLDLCVSSLRRGHANLLCIVPILTDDPRRESKLRIFLLTREDGMGHCASPPVGTTHSPNSPHGRRARVRTRRTVTQCYVIARARFVLRVPSVRTQLHGSPCHAPAP